MSNTQKPEQCETYLGDGVYASFDGYQIWLRTFRGGEEPDRIALEPAVFAALVKFHAALSSLTTAPETK